MVTLVGQYNVYSQKLDARNQMPGDLSNKAKSASSGIASSARVASTIPKGGTDDGTWTYPSPEMFYNALSRKNKLEGAKEEDMDMVVAIHNNMNESTWAQVMAWESLHDPSKRGPGEEPKLLRFMGRPHDLSPKAQLKMLCGHTKPFDRHDWIVDRGGTEVRYVIDYYHDESQVSVDQKPKHLLDTTSMKSISVDVRPALDSFQSVFDVAFRMPMKLAAGTTSYSPPPFLPKKNAREAEEKKITIIDEKWKKIKDRCHGCKEKLRNCLSDEECSSASVALQLCIAKVACPSTAKAFEEATSKLRQNMQKSENDVSVSYDKITQCLDDFELDSRQLKRS